MSRMRGTHTHGGGAKKKRRGGGHRGGRGRAGTGKRADQKKPSVWGKDYFGRSGFKSPTHRIVNACNLRFIEAHFNQLLEQGKIKKESGVYVVDLQQLGYDKLLSSGTLSHACKIIVSSASAKTADKVQAAGGELVVASQGAGVSDASGAAGSEAKVEKASKE